MMTKVNVYRGWYGPLPVTRLHQLDRLMLNVRAISAWFSARFVSLPLRAMDENERQILANCAQQVAFPMLRELLIPKEFHVIAANPSAGSKDTVTICLDNGRGRSFEISQRIRWLPLAEEFSLAGVPATRLSSRNGSVFMVHGRYGGEPIDHSYWMTRRAVALEVGPLRLELREVVNTGCGILTLLHCARKMRKKQS